MEVGNGDEEASYSSERDMRLRGVGRGDDDDDAGISIFYVDATGGPDKDG